MSIVAGFKLVARRSLPTAIGNQKNRLLLRMVELISHLKLHRGGASLMAFRLCQFIVKSGARAMAQFVQFRRSSPFLTGVVWYSLL